MNSFRSDMEREISVRFPACRAKTELHVFLETCWHLRHDRKRQSPFSRSLWLYGEVALMALVFGGVHFFLTAMLGLAWQMLAPLYLVAVFAFLTLGGFVEGWLDRDRSDDAVRAFDRDLTAGTVARDPRYVVFMAIVQALRQRFPEGFADQSGTDELLTAARTDLGQLFDLLCDHPIGDDADLDMAELETMVERWSDAAM